MKALFQKRLLLLVVVTFMASSVSYYLISRVLARNDAIRLIRDSLSFACSLVEDYDHNFEELNSIIKSSVLSEAHKLAVYIGDNPSSVEDSVKLSVFVENLIIERYMITDEKGVVVASSDERLVGFDLNSTPETREFLVPIKNVEAEIVKDSTETIDAGGALLYACVSRSDSPGIVLVGYAVSDITKTWKFTDVAEIGETFCVGKNGEVRITPNLCGWEEGERVFYEDVYDVPSLCVSTPCKGHIMTGSLPITEVYRSCERAYRAMTIGNVLLFSLIFFLVSRLLQVVVVKGIYSLNDSLAKITAGDLDEKASVATTPEFVALSEGVNTTVEALRLAIEKESQRNKSEMEMSRLIQTSMLPTDGDFTFGDKFQLAASMQAATAVGGDFYDFFSIDETRFAALISDVSGHGISAALFMASSKTLIKELLQSGLSPEEAYIKANQKLCVNNNAGMFLTSFLIVADVKTHTLTCVNAGHNPPVIKNPNGTWKYLEIDHSLMLGAWDESVYTGVSVPFEPGARILLYTDGVTEAMNPEGELFGEPQLLDVLNNEENGSADDTIKLVRKAVDRHANGTPQSDDVTIVCLARLP